MKFLLFMILMTVLFSFCLTADHRMSVKGKGSSSFEKPDSPIQPFAQKLVDLIIKFDKNRYFQTVIDIGSGTGDITKWFSTKIDHGHLYGIDIDAKDFKIAEKYQKTEKIDYVLTDLSGDWSLAAEPIRRLQSNVSLAFSNFCIMYVKERLTFVQNLRRLMPPGARAYISFVLMPDSTFKLTDELRERFGRYLKTPPIDEQLKTWTDLFKSNGFTIEYQLVEPIPMLFRKNQHDFLYWDPKILETFHKSDVYWEDLSDDIRNTLIRVSVDPNLTQNSVDWKTLDRLKNEGQTRDLEIIYTNVYIVCKAIV